MKLLFIALSTSFAYCKLFTDEFDLDCQKFRNENLTWEPLSSVPMPLQYSRSSEAILPAKTPTLVHLDYGQEIPEHFDSREKWPHCESIGEVREQGDCGSCWAVSSASVISDRICIHSNQTDQTRISATDILACCKHCGYGCGGGFPYSVMQYWVDNGVVSGGQDAPNLGCKSYPYNMTDVTPECVAECDPGSGLTYESDKRYGSEAYLVSQDERQIQLEIMENGPVAVNFVAHSSYMCYKSGIYQGGYLDEVTTWYHVIKVIGWGIEEGVPYWLVSNTLGKHRGENGIEKFIRGPNDSKFGYGIITAAIP